jgi:hypothetical protein
MLVRIIYCLNIPIPKNIINTNTLYAIPIRVIVIHIFMYIIQIDRSKCISTTH